MRGWCAEKEEEWRGSPGDAVGRRDVGLGEALGGGQSGEELGVDAAVEHAVPLDSARAAAEIEAEAEERPAPEVWSGTAGQSEETAGGGRWRTRHDTPAVLGPRCILGRLEC